MSKVKRIYPFYHLYTKKLGLDVNELKDTCFVMHDIIKNNFKPNGISDYGAQSTLTTNLYAQYNILLYPLPGIHSLHNKIRKTFRKLIKYADKKESDFFIQCWLNVYEKEQFIDWHGHWSPHCNSWHGFYCVDCEPSKTTYDIGGRIVDVESENDLLVIGESDGDLHRTWPWTGNEPRITIAFDIVPAKYIDAGNWLNHWIPI